MQLMEKNQIKPGPFTYLAVLNHCEDSKVSFSILQDFLKLPKNNYDFKVFIRVLQRYVHRKEWGLALDVLSLMVSRGVGRSENMLQEVAKAFGAASDITVLQKSMNMISQLHVDPKAQNVFLVSGRRPAR